MHGKVLSYEWPGEIYKRTDLCMKLHYMRNMEVLHVYVCVEILLHGNMLPFVEGKLEQDHKSFLQLYINERIKK
jgi:hypothetical protein